MIAARTSESRKPHRRRLSHVLSVDVEDYFMVEAFADSVPKNSWHLWPSRVVENTRLSLDLFDRFNVKATFFFVGWIAAKFPGLVREVHKRGHELACHSYWHRTIYSLTPDEFRRDTRIAVQAIEDAAGVKVYGYRAPSWSITDRCIWALDILAEEGFVYDSSIFPIRHDIYGMPAARRFPYELTCRNGARLLEYPPSTVRVCGQNLPGGGGGYLRILPLAYTRWLFHKYETVYKERVTVYFHPWELDPSQPRLSGKLMSRLRHYTNLHRTEERLCGLLKSFHFVPLRDVISDLGCEGLERSRDFLTVEAKAAQQDYATPEKRST
jgi:polysaccharide deacetylase family protein (PEP-CTERM system associated)